MRNDVYARFWKSRRIHIVRARRDAEIPLARIHARWHSIDVLIVTAAWAVESRSRNYARRALVLFVKTGMNWLPNCDPEVRRWIIATTVVAVATAISLSTIDVPLARAAAQFHLYRKLIGALPVELPVMLVSACIAVVQGLGFIATGRRPPKWSVAAMLAGFALCGSLAVIEIVLKPVFGRAAPHILLHDGLSGFYWFRWSRNYASFPSGHSDQAAAILSVFWVYYPRARALYLSLATLLACTLVLGEWHFLGDIIAGGYVGTVAGALTMRFWRKSGQPLSVG